MKKIGNLRKIILKSQFADSSTDQVKKTLGYQWIEKDGLLTFLKPSRELILSFNPIDKNKFDVYNTNNSILNDINNNKGKNYFDFVFDYSAPFNINYQNSNTDNSFANIAAATKFEIKANYNFGLKSYEDFSKQNYILETDLLSYYLVLARDITKDQKIEDLVSLHYVGKDFTKNLLDDNLLDSTDGSKKYFTDYAKNYDYIYHGNIMRKLNYVCISDKDFKNFLNTDNNKKDLFTNYINLKLYKDTEGELLKAAKLTGLNFNILHEIFNTYTNNPATEQVIVNSLNYEKRRKQDSQSSNTIFENVGKIDLQIQKSVNKDQKLKYFNFGDFLNNLNANRTEQQRLFNDLTGLNNKPFFIGKKENQGKTDLAALIFTIKANDIFKKYLRTYQDIINGRPCYSEILNIIIEKRRNGADQVIQTFSFENNDSDFLSFIDTQIKKDKEYNYKIFYYIAVIGNKYSYDVNTRFYASTISVANTPEVRVYQVPVDPVNVEALRIYPAPKTPPASPIVVTIPYKDFKDRIKFNFIKNTDKYKSPFKIIQEEDRQKLEVLFQSQEVPDDLRNINTPILFKSEISTGADPHILESVDPIEKYEIFKTTTPPTKYEDFKNKLYATISNASFVDTEILTNTKYYYMFRSVNTEGYPSNPTVVYEVEIVENSGIFYHVIKPYEFDIKEISKDTKQFRRFLYVSAALTQTLLNATIGSQLSTATNNVSLGPVDPSVWNKPFKIRITSKQTGRKIDVNFTMKYAPKGTNRT